MPIYEYDCRGCHRRVSVLVRSLSGGPSPRCPRCDSAELTRLMSRFATVKSEDARLDSFADPAQYGDLNENDPQSVARFVKRMGAEMGEDLGEDLDAAMDEGSRLLFEASIVEITERPPREADASPAPKSA